MIGPVLGAVLVIGPVLGAVLVIGVSEMLELVLQLVF